MNPHAFLTITIFTKIHLKKSHHLFALRISFFDRRTHFLSHVLANIHFFVFAFSFASIYLSQSARNIYPSTPNFALKQKVLVRPAPLRILTKHIVRLRCRCFFVLRFFFTFSKCACGPHAVKNSYIFFNTKMMRNENPLGICTQCVHFRVIFLHARVSPLLISTLSFRFVIASCERVLGVQRLV